VNEDSSSGRTSIRMTIFTTTILSIILVIGIVTSTFLTSSSLFQFNGKIITDAKATSSSGSVQGRAGLVSNTPHKQAMMIASDATIQVKPGIKVGVWTFNGTVPGPTLRFTEGDNVTIHFFNKTPVPHTLHLQCDHNAKADGVFETILPNQTYNYNFIAGPAGAFPYHCHALPTSQHMRMGMYGMMIIDPKDPSILKPAREYGVVMGELDKNYTNVAAQYYLNNGYFDQYMGNNSLPVRQNELVRLYVVNMGTALVYPFHIHGTIFKEYPSGLISNKPEDHQTVLTGPGDATIIGGKWQYPGSFLFHAHGIEEERGGMGCFYVIPTTNLTSETSSDHVCSWQSSASSPNIKTSPALTPVTNKSVSMIDWQYQLQKDLQKPIPTTAAEENEHVATVSNIEMHTSDLNQNLRSASTIDIPIGAATPKNGQYYAPEKAQLPVNSKVSWTNKDNIPHTSTADDNSFDTDIINPGDSSSPITLSGSAGANIAYHCALHPWMKASITLSSSPSTSLATAGQVQNVRTPTVTNNSNVPHLKDASLKVEKVLSGLDSPTNIGFIKNNDYIILEKNGTVLRAINGSLLDKPLLKVNVSNGFFQGMLGIAIGHSNKTSSNTTSATSSGSNNESPLPVFLYYTEDKGNGTSRIGNRLYRYDLVNNTLINSKLLLNLPALRDSWGNGGAITIGPDNNIYVTMGSAGNDDFVPSTMTLNYRNSSIVDGRSGILRITQDGKPVGNGILGDSYPLNLYYAYGLENSYGIDFDPISKTLWDVENDGDFNDELNIVKPGFNSGYGMISGSSADSPAVPSALVNFSGNGIYKDPEFVWVKKPVALGTKFLPSDKLGKQYQNDLFVGGFQDGRIYHFKLNADRTHLALPKSLNPNVSPPGLASADLPIAEPVIFGEGFGGISNLAISSDGYLYVVAIGTGDIYRISQSTAANASKTTTTTSFTNATTAATTAISGQKNVIAVSIEPGASDLADKAFNPSTVNIKVGDTVVWTNNDPVIHTVVEGSPSLPSAQSTIRPEASTLPAEFKSGFLSQGMTFEHTFDKPGTFNYYCSVHPTMIGKVVVASSH
jgi:plastocyanin